ncbi:MAG: alpha/beta hydrolase [Moorea sp. SIO1F2]|uniref:alpha/beta fold hydrolase n=1 Tax=unclassified Moorena TaxID=2683338 RepID=UPI0013B9B94E|nr:MULTISPECIES: alpha/beta hydrolase [unclassified Moorena]NEN98492.1 alpha/beta hydrolase [Moorena sp. SIO3I7]NEO66749.1 alpha/beta hydrolase [Moorena sp. SIO4G2]NEO04846.1 alpha/beta hydrolase [Moorena sp. SIO3I8]NEO19548.1 alpha/beta hydrolase [Moorena sp. SIO4A5]NEQ60171.1 alpha/beta hydrolase [Moorena sp. SIO4A1]
MATINILGVSHTYELTPPTQSSCPVLVFIHGWLLSRSYWQPLIYRLSQQYQCLIYDLRGFGESQSQIHNTQSSTSNPDSESPFPETTASSTDRYTLAAYAQDLGILLEKLGIEQAWLVGHSLGGSIAIWGAYLLPQRIQGVICLNAGGGIYLKEEFERFRLAGEQLVKRRPRWLCYVPLLDLLFTRAQVARPIARKWGRQRVIDFVTANAEAALRTLLDSTTEAEVHRLPQVVFRLKQPVYFIAGTQDKVMEPKYVRHLASFHSLFQSCGDNVIEIGECGHMAMVEKPETIDDQIRQILANYS